MKKIVIFVMTMLLCMSFAGTFACGAPENEHAETPNTPHEQDEEIPEQPSDPEEEPTSSVKFSVMVVGDTHINASKSLSVSNFRETLEYVRDNGIKVFVSNGDFVDSGSSVHYDVASSVIEEVFSGVEKENMPEFIFNMGNHEFSSDYETDFASFRAFANRWMSTPLTERDNIYLRQIDGINYIVAFSSKTGKTDGASYTDADFDKLERLLEQGTQNDTPCIVLTHFPWGYAYGGSAGPAKARMQSLLGKYPSVINMTSHTHYSVLHERTLDQTDYTTLAIGAQSDEYYLSGAERDENGDVVTYGNISGVWANNFVGDSLSASLYRKKHFGVRLDFGEKSVVIKRIDLTEGTVYDHGSWIIPYGITKENKHDKFYYEAGERSGEPLVFGEDAKISVKFLKDNDADTFTMEVKFPDVEKCYAVEGYKIKLYGSDGKLIKSVGWHSLFWAGLEKKSEYTVYIRNLPIPVQTGYTVRIYPMDFFGHYNDPLEQTIISENVPVENAVTDMVEINEVSKLRYEDGTFVSVSDWQNSGRSISFKYKKTNVMTGEHIWFCFLSGDSYIPCDPNDTKGFKLLLNSNTLQINYQSFEGHYTVEDVGDGWYRITIDLAAVPRGNATGTETIDGIFFYWVACGILFDEAKVV